MIFPAGVDAANIRLQSWHLQKTEKGGVEISPCNQTSGLSFGLTAKIIPHLTYCQSKFSLPSFKEVLYASKIQTAFFDGFWWSERAFNGFKRL